MGRVESLIRGLLKPINPYATSILGFLTLTWGLWIVNPWWEVFSSAAIFSEASQFAPEWAWGTWSTLCGALILLTLYDGKAKVLSWALAFATWHWWTISYMFFWGDWQNTAGLVYFWVGVYSVFCYLNIRINYVKSGKTRV